MSHEVTGRLLITFFFASEWIQFSWVDLKRNQTISTNWECAMFSLMVKNSLDLCLFWNPSKKRLHTLRVCKVFLLVKYPLEFCLFYRPSKKGLHTYEVCNLFFEGIFSPQENLRIIRCALRHCTPQRCAIFSLAEFSPILIC